MKESSRELEMMAVTGPKRFCFLLEGVVSIDCNHRECARNIESWGRGAGLIGSERAFPKIGWRFRRVSGVDLVPSRGSAHIVCPEACALRGILTKWAPAEPAHQPQPSPSDKQAKGDVTLKSLVCHAECSGLHGAMGELLN